MKELGPILKIERNFKPTQFVLNATRSRLSTTSNKLQVGMTGLFFGNFPVKFVCTFVEVRSKKDNVRGSFNGISGGKPLWRKSWYESLILSLFF